MNKIFLLLMLFASALLATNNYDVLNGKSSGLEISKFFVSIKLDDSISKSDLEKELSQIQHLSGISQIKQLSDNSFVVKLKENISKEAIIELKKQYIILPSYTLNQKKWPLITDNTINIKFKDSVTKDVKNLILSNNKLKIVDTDIFNDKILTLQTREDAFEISNKLFNTGLFDWSNPNFYMFHIKKFVPNDTYYNNQWHHESNTAGVYSEGAWDITRGSSSIKIAIIDDGMDLNHEDLNIIASSDFSGSSGFNDGGVHGTSCAGVAGATGNNSKGVSGACMNCSILAAKIMRDDGYSLQNADKNAFNWATSQGVDIYSNSWGYEQDFDINQYNPALVSAINYAVDNSRDGKGGIVLFASGNENRRFLNSSLEGLPNIIAVGASSNWASRSSYSNYGDRLSIVAPSNGGSLSIWTTDRTGSAGYESGNYTSTFGGTSSATPLVSGIVGLMLSENANLTRTQVKQILENTADKIGSGYDVSGHSDYLGYGKVNAKNALIAVRDLNGCTPSATGENCTNGVDDDCDGAIDGNDSDCQETPDECANVNCPVNSSCGVDGTQAYCYCNEGYEVNADQTACESTGGTTGVCDGINCEELYANSECVDDGGTAACGCKSGYAWNSAQTDCVSDSQGDVCDAVSCSNHGNCVVRSDNAVCLCDTGYHAENLSCLVDTTVNPCEGITCSSHGICLENGGTPICDCNNGYHSDGNLHCIQDTATCVGITCSGHGNCDISSGNAICICDNGYHSDANLHCVLDSVTSGCDNVTCSGKGNCDMYGSTPTCVCIAGYHNNSNLECIVNDAVNVCSGVYCSSYGDCYESAGKAYCDCDSGYTDSALNCVEGTDNNNNSSSNVISCNYDSSSKTLPFFFMILFSFVIIFRKKLLNK